MLKTLTITLGGLIYTFCALICVFVFLYGRLTDVSCSSDWNDVSE